MLQFEYVSEIHEPVDAVFAFHERPDAFERLVPPWQKVEIVRHEGGIQAGAIVEFRLRFGPLYRTWVAKHIGYSKNRFFIDEQEKGPFRTWLHVHSFKPEGGGTRLTDSIELSLPGGKSVETLFGWLVRAMLNRMFRYRHAATKQACEAAG
jgi:ligand-binding SRPBCC domain-containing protein